VPLPGDQEIDFNHLSAILRMHSPNSLRNCQHRIVPKNLRRNAPGVWSDHVFNQGAHAVGEFSHALIEIFPFAFSALAIKFQIPFDVLKIKLVLPFDVLKINLALMVRALAIDVSLPLKFHDLADAGTNIFRNPVNLLQKGSEHGFQTVNPLCNVTRHRWWNRNHDS
jgi:hypothetical protein